ncbi:Predicted N-acyltransferase, GNAT family [Atopomonas hussainii]|uniref:Predicted N-acyltransferase, GNAT family n=1 Tax=Atopomonas hussainii TaxID=1429083 RepID=A0A1H7RB10_9GAMM|nr:GNAT family N-acetyltransferase [Atopomonas hussainii]SEL57383.1 Predicted N-acyltransferase, GNAT family [Atopomonas hussainii]
MSDIHVRLADWQADQALLTAIRQAVFIDEQAVPAELEWDAEDARCQHLLAMAGDTAIGTARLLADGHIGRVAVLKDWRGHQVGLKLMQAAMQLGLEQGMRVFLLSAQVHAIAFYERLGYQVTSEPYDDAGIPHVDMRYEHPA